MQLSHDKQKVGTWIDGARVGTLSWHSNVQVTIEKYIFNILFAFHVLTDYVSDELQSKTQNL